MDPPLLAFFLTSLLTNTLLLLLLLFSLNNFPSAPLFTPPLLLSSSTLTATTTTTSYLLLSRKRKRPQQLPHRLPPSNPDHYPLLFRVSASTFDYLSGLLDPLLVPPRSTLAGPAVLALALARLASGSPYPALARQFDVPARLARDAARRLRRVLLANFRFWLAFPQQQQDVVEASRAFGSLSGLAGCCGALACDRLPGHVAAQLVADASSRILSVAAGFRGERSDFDVLKLSSLCKDLDEGKHLDAAQYLVGYGGGYPLLPWLMVPFAGSVPPGSREEKFNAAVAIMCRPVRRAIRSLRGWGVIARLDEEEGPRAAAACIGTCAMLHNVLLSREDYSALAPEEEQEEEEEEAEAEAEVEGSEVDPRAVAKRYALAERL